VIYALATERLPVFTIRGEGRCREDGPGGQGSMSRTLTRPAANARASLDGRIALMSPQILDSGRGQRRFPRCARGTPALPTSCEVVRRGEAGDAGSGRGKLKVAPGRSGQAKRDPAMSGSASMPVTDDFNAHREKGSDADVPRRG
jgi:hypothetical protein